MKEAGMNEMSRDEFIDYLVRNGWSRESAIAEWDYIQDEEEGEE